MIGDYVALQGSLPLMLHENPQNIFFLGMGTGISVAGALPFSLETSPPLNSYRKSSLHQNYILRPI